MRFYFLRVGHVPTVIFEKVIERWKWIVKYSVEIESLELNVFDYVTDIFHFDNKVAVRSHKIFHRINKSMRVFQMSKDAWGDDDVGFSVLFYYAVRALLIEKSDDSSESGVIGYFPDVYRRVDTDSFYSKSFKRF